MEIFIQSPSTMYVSLGCYKLTRHKDGKLFWKFHHERSSEGLPIIDLAERKVVEEGTRCIGREFHEADLEKT